MGYHPHGVLGYGAIAAFGTDVLKFPEIFPGLTPRLITLKLNFQVGWLPLLHCIAKYCLYQNYISQVPGGREVGLASGMCSASKESLGAILR